MAVKTQYLDINISINKLMREDHKQVLSFSCGCDELDKFFHQEMCLCAKHHYISAYCAKDIMDNKIVAIFTLSNDSVVIDNVEDKDDFVEESKTKINGEYIATFEKQTSFPSINIGHLGVRTDLHSKGIGEQILDFVLYTFSNYDISGCQFITVDSLNNSRTNKFYTRYGFVNQTNNDNYCSTRRMYIPIQLFESTGD